MVLPPSTSQAQAPFSSPLTPLPATAPLVTAGGGRRSGFARWPADSSQHAPTELATSSLQVPELPSSSSYVVDTSLLSIDPACSPLAATPRPLPAGGRGPSAAAPAGSPPRPVKLGTADDLLVGLDQAALRYQAAIDAIAAKYGHAGSEADGSESSGIELVERDELVELFTRRLVEDEPLSSDDDDGRSALGATGSEADEVDEDDALDGPAAEAKEKQLLTQPAGRGSGSRRAGYDDGGVFRQDGNPTWCWVEDTPSPPSGVSSSSLVFTLLLQQGASLTASLAHATHILLALPPGPVADPAGLSALHWSILLGSKPNDARFVLSAEWVRDCARTGIRLREALYEIKLPPAAAPIPPTPSVAAGHLQAWRTPARERQRSGLDGQRVTPRGVSRLKVYFSAPDRLGRPTATSSTLTPSKDHLIPAFPGSPGPSRPANIKPEPHSPPGGIRLSAKAAGKQRAQVPLLAENIKSVTHRAVQRESTRDLKPDIKVNKRPSTSRLPGAGLSKRSRVPKLLSEIRPPPPPLPKPPRPKATRAKQEHESGGSDEDDCDGARRADRRLKERNSECYG